MPRDQSAITGSDAASGGQEKDGQPPRRSALEITATEFRRCGPDALLALRLGAFSNAIQAQLPARSDSNQPWLPRDQMYRLLVSIGYLKESIDLIQQAQPRIRSLMKRARNAGYPAAKWSMVSPLLTQGAGTLHDRAVETLRHAIGFHFDAEVFAKWLDSRQADERLVLWEVWGADSHGRTYRASADAMVASMAPDVEGLKSLLRDTAAAQLALIAVAEGVLVGALLAAGVSLKALLRQDAATSNEAGTETER